MANSPLQFKPLAYPDATAVVLVPADKYNVWPFYSDNTKEYIHVLKAPEGQSIDLPLPKEEFKSAVLYGGRSKVALSVQGDVLRLTLPAGAKWSELDTVIELALKNE